MDALAPSSGPLPSPETSKQAGRSGYVRDWLVTLLIAMVVLLLLNLFVFNLSTVRGHSMQPTLMESQHLFVNKLIYNFHDPGRGDIVILKDPDSKLSSPRFLVKRVIGIPGDVIRVEHNQLYVNGELLNEPYTNSDVEDGDYGPFTVEPEHFFVMGDNRHIAASKDSRYFGSIKSQDLLGRAEFIFWPISEWKWL
ncbi:signal peptidase I [Paenibacillus jamilae]|uniref:signal peptidase I n=1 Tax=Paenibacillus TaxID=44249 RepID=UPI00077CB528|nr:signal peptidase I [Paenibacillus polymyxa]KYG92489.1 signal peptidase I [Paenibacillus polymyxa]MDY7991222.1 signal peptidase I [Paenibacillus polymyxa]MDY8117661.1 signal peptidase I [Paenibacillus polymyxa]URJ40299.1 signal peptidase I [Paenibacillus polymyxa]